MNVIFFIFLTLTIFSILSMGLFTFQQQAISLKYDNKSYAKSVMNSTTNQEKGYNQSFIYPKLEDALKLYDAALSFQPNATDILSNKGMVLIKLQRYVEANKVFDKILSINPKNITGLYNKGVVLDKMGNTSKAIKYYKRALKINPHYYPKLINRLSLSLSMDNAKPEEMRHSVIKNKSF